jgi:hypothetical protein
VRHNLCMAKPRSNSESPHDAPDIPPDELLGYLGLPSYPPDRSEGPGHTRRRDGARAVAEAAQAVDGEAL